jgi:hypothetical protein
VTVFGALLAEVPQTVAVQCVSAGFGGSWVVILENGAIYSHSLPESLKQQLPANAKGIIQVCSQSMCQWLVPNNGHQPISLSLSDLDQYLIAFADGDSYYILDSCWLSAVAAVSHKCVLQCTQQLVNSAYSHAANMQASVNN